MAFMRSQHIAHLLLGGHISSSALETALTTNDAFLGAWKRLIKSGTVKSLIASTTSFAIIAGSPTAFGDLLTLSGAQLAASDSATEAISNNSDAIKTVVTNTTYLDLWQNVSANKARLLARVNATGSKLKSQTWTADGTWTAPGTAIVALSVFAIGPGGNGGSSVSPTGGGKGGGAGEYAFQQWTTGLPTTNQTVTVPASSGTAASFGSYLTADSGSNGGAAFSGGTGGGSTTGSAIYDSDVANAIWQPNTGSVAGPNGGNGASSAPGSGSNGTDGLSGSGGTGGSPGNAGTGGSGFGSSGGGGGFYTGFGGSTGGSATGYGTGGGGAGIRGGDTASGGPGGGAYVKAWWVEG